ncbi:MAG: zinc metallopeptidase [Planctomycetia bacterium]|nr:zinc metallopeptidase [Planctomycetia bacterium]
MLDYVPMSLLYGLPLVPIFIAGHVSHKRQERKISKLTEAMTSHTAESVAQKVLNDVGLKKITVSRGDDFSVNAYNPETGQVELSPETIGQKDISSIGLALYAICSLVHAKENPVREKMRESLKQWEPIAFWTVFSVLAFGLMADSAPAIITGYLLAVVIFIMHRMKVRLNREAASVTLKQAVATGLFKQEEQDQIADALAAIASNS